MTRKAMLAGFALIFTISTGCQEHVLAPDEGFFRPLTPLEKNLVESSDVFGLKMFRETVAFEQNRNIFISPLSISMALGMTLNGAEGETRQAMENALALTGMSREDINSSYRSLIDLLTGIDPKVRFQIANSIWYRQGMSFEQAFLDANKTYFDAVVQALNFDDAAGAAKVMNAWVNENTNGKIDKIIDAGDIDANTVMFLMNAIYFKGKWKFQFKPELTRDDWFHLSDVSQKQVPFMHQSGTLSYNEQALFQAVDLPYGNGSFRMLILLPKENVAIDSLVAAMTPENWQAWLAGFREVPVDLAMPKFTLEYKLSLNEILKSLGMEIAFDPFRADFTGMNRAGGLFLDQVKHKTFVEVDEEGTEAAAVTSVEVNVTSVGPQNVQMKIDRPFVFLIREKKSGAILFIGKMLDPAADE